MQADDPPYLSVGTAVSAKYKGAFCEAKVSNATHVVKCKVTFKMGLGSATVSDEYIRGTLRVGQLVQARHPDKKEFLDATITKIQDCSQYTVVFDDGDITTLRRTALCLKSGRHFNESETLDQLPLTHPEHFGNPVVGGRRGRRNRQLKEDDSEEEAEERNEPDLIGYSADVGRVVVIETSEKKRSKDTWFPALVVIPSAQPTVRINMKDEYLVRSFKDGRYYTVPKKEVTEFKREIAEKVENSLLADAVERTLRYIDGQELPDHWDRSTLFNLQTVDSDFDENATDSDDDEQSEEKDLFVAQLYKFMEDSRTPLNTSPVIAKRDVDLQRLFRLVEGLGGFKSVSNQNKWKMVASKLKLPNNASTANQVQNVYKVYLLSFEGFYRTLGVTMHVNTRSTKKKGGRSLIRDKDRSTPINSPRPDKDEEMEKEMRELKREEKKEVIEEKPKRKSEIKREEEKKKDLEEKIEIIEIEVAVAGTSTSGVVESGRPKRNKSEWSKERKSKIITSGKSKEESADESGEKEEEKIQQTRSKSQLSKTLTTKESKESPAPKEPTSEKKPRETKPPTREVQPSAKPVVAAKVVKKVSEDEKKRSSVRKRLAVDEKPPLESPTSSAAAETTPSMPVNKGDKLMVFYGPYESESKITYEAKVLEIDNESGDQPSYLVHYTGWNTRYDEWITVHRIAENVTAKVKSYKQGGVTITSATPNLKGKNVIRRGRGMSFSGKTSSDAPRSTTPSSITSSSSRTKSPATPVTRSSNRVRQDSLKRIRRGSSQTEASNHSDSDSDASESEVETMRTRSTSKADQEIDVVRSSKRRAVKTLSVKLEKRRMEGESEKDEEPEKTLKRRRVVRKYEDKDVDKGNEFEVLKRGRPPALKKSEDEDTEKEDDFEQLKKGRPSKKSQDGDSDKKEQLDSPKFFKKIAKYDEEDTESDDKFSVNSKTSKPFSDSEREETVIIKIKSSPEKSTEESEEDEDSVNPPKGREFDLNQIRLELKGLPVKVLPDKESIVTSDGDDSTQASESVTKEEPTVEEIEEEELEFNTEKGDKSPNSDIYEFKEPEPFELETRKFVEDKKRVVVVPRIIEDLDSPSKKKGSKSPLKQEPGSAEKKKRKSPFKSKLLDDTDEDSDKIDAFDKLVVSPSYNVVKTLTPEQLVQQQKAVEKILEEPLFTELPESMDAITSNQQQIFTREDGLFSDAYLKSSPGRNMDLDFDRPEENKSEDSDKEDSLRESIQRVIAQTSTDEDSNDDLHVMPPLSSYQGKKKDDAKASTSIESFDDVVEKESPPPEETEKEEKPKYISPALQETDSSLLESMVSQPLVINREDIKDINVKTGVTKITDSILQKINSFKNKGESKSPKREEMFDFKKESPVEKVKEDLKIKPTLSSKIVDIRKTELEKPKEVKLPIKCLKSTSQPELSPLANLITSLEKNIQPVTVTVPVTQNITFSNVVSTVCTTPVPVSVKPTSKSPVSSIGSEGKKRKKVISRAYVEDSDIDSSDSEQLVIAKSDDESRVEIRSDAKQTVSSTSVSLVQELTTDESQSQEGDSCFKFDEDVKPEEASKKSPDRQAEPEESDCGKEEEEEEEPDPHLHSLLLCEETIPRSPVPAIEPAGTSEDRSSSREGKSVLEMPFASAPGTSNNAVAACSKSVVATVNVFGPSIEPNKAAAAAPKPQQPSPPLLMALQQPRPDNRSSTMQDTPPTTPESSVSLSPHGENGFMSPNIADNDSCKSNEGESDFIRQRRNSSNKVSPYSEEDTQMTGESSSTKKQADLPTRKRRKSSRSDDVVPVKRGRKPMNRSRHNSDSDDTSEHSTSGSTNINTTVAYVRSSQSPRPAKYNFVVEFDPSVDSSQRIAVLQQKLSELRKCYADVKSELATVERRRKKLRRREREAKATKQETSPT